MNILGLSAHFHDACAALIQGDRLVAAAAEERFTRQKHDANFPTHAAAFCLEEAGFDAGDLDAVVFYEQPHVKFTRVLASTLAGFPSSGRAFIGAMKGWLSSKIFIRNEISRALSIHPSTVHFVPHHMSHASYAFAACGFDEAAILTVDAVGEWACTTLAHGRRGEPVRILESFEYPHSIGLLYAAVTAFLGFRPNSDECSTMALSAFGRPRYVEDFRQVLRAHDDGSYELDPTYFDFLNTRGLPLRPSFFERFGDAATVGALGELDALGPLPRALPDRLQRFVDIAASLQVVLEETLLGLLRRLSERTGCKALCLAGGVALNCVAVGRLLKDGPFDELFIPPDPGDGGGAIGAALALSGGSGPIQGADTPYLGKAYDPSQTLEMTTQLDHDVWRRSGPGVTATRVPQRVVVERFDDEASLIERVVDLLRGGAIVGWSQGRFELGPRALGNRSILAAPDSIETARRLSTAVKSRAAFRPYAFSIAQQAASRALNLNGEAPRPSRWMQWVCPVDDTLLPQVRAACHVDGTSRPQICSAEDNPRYHRLLEVYGQAAGTPALLNTSLNERGTPMAASPVEALAMLARTDMDALVLDLALVRKQW